MLPTGTGCLAHPHRYRVARERRTVAASRRLQILAVGADDIVLGNGSKILRLLAEWPASRITWNPDTATAAQAAWVCASAAGFSVGAPCHDVTVTDLPTATFAHLQGPRICWSRSRWLSRSASSTPQPRTPTRTTGRRPRSAGGPFGAAWSRRDEIRTYDGDLRRSNQVVSARRGHARAQGRSARDVLRGAAWCGGDAVRANARPRGIKASAPLAKHIYASRLII